MPSKASGGLALIWNGSRGIADVSCGIVLANEFLGFLICSSILDFMSTIFRLLRPEPNRILLF